MHIFVTGGSGLTGPTVVSELIAAGHTVTGLARSDQAAQRLRELGASTYPGSLEDTESLRTHAGAADAVLHMAFGGDFADPVDLIRRDRTAIEVLGSALIGSGKPFVITSGTFVMPAGQVSTERDAPDPSSVAWFRIPGEQACLELTMRNVKTSVVRLAPTVYGPEDHGFIAILIAAARRTGVSAYIGDGSNRWPAIHRLDAAKLFRLALEQAPAGSVLHGTGEEAISLRSIAEKIGAKLGLRTKSLTPEEAVGHFGGAFFATAFGTDAPVSSAHTQTLLGWSPNQLGLLETLEDGDYFLTPPQDGA